MYGKTFSIIGGDGRMRHVAEKLANCGLSVSGYGLEKYADAVKECDSLNEALNNSSYIVLGLPYSKDEKFVYAPFLADKIPLDDIYSATQSGSIVFGGNIGKQEFKENGRIFDYYKREELQIKNAAITAECALRDLADNGVSVADKKILIVGYGRIGKCLAYKLKSIGADVAVTARKNTDMAWANVTETKAYHTADMANIINGYDIVFNTAPALVINKDVLLHARKETLFAELASKPGGIDREAASALNVKIYDMPSLPGRLDARSAGGAIAETILNIIEEEKLR